MLTFKVKKNKNCNISFGLVGTYSDHEKYYVSTYNNYLKVYPNSIIFPIFIGGLPSDFNGSENEIFRFSSYDINPGYLQYMFSNFDTPVVFIGVDTKPGKNLIVDELISSSINIVYSRRYILDEYKNTITWINNMEHIDFAIVDKKKSYGVTELPINILKTKGLSRILNMSMKDSSPDKFELRKIAEKVDEDGFFFEKI